MSYRSKVELQRHVSVMKMRQKKDSDLARQQAFNAERAVTDESRARCLDSVEVWSRKVRNRDRQITLIKARITAMTEDA